MNKKTIQTTPQVVYTGDIPNSPIAFVIHASKPYKHLAFGAFIAVTLAQLLGVSLSYLLKLIVDSTTIVSDVGGVTYEETFFWILMFPITTFFMFLCWRLSGFIGMQWLTQTEAEAYRLLYKYLSSHSHSYFSNRFAGALSNKVSNASEGTFRILDSTLWNHYPAVLNLFATGFVIYITSAYIGIIFTALVIFLLPVNYFLAKWRRPYVVAYSASKSKFRGSAVDLLTNISAMRQYSRFKQESKSLDVHINTVRTADLCQWKMSEWILVLNNFIITLAVGGMLLVMFFLWESGKITVGDFVLVVTLVMNLQSTLTFIGNAINQFIRVYGEVEEGLTEILQSHEVVDKITANKLKTNTGEVVWKDVTFDFAENRVFDNFNLTIKPGQRVGLVGSSGAGKTTFVSLLLRQHDLSSGSIEIDNQNIAEVTQDSLRENIAVVPQEPMLFHRSIKENIAYGNPKATQAEIEEVAKQAQAHDFIVKLPEGYNTLVGERGVKLSGGQKQRVAIARAMLKDAPILVLDEATSALDSESEVAIQTALHKLMEGKTVVAIAHRLSTLREMDRIIVLETGKIVEDGTHETLTKAGGTYARLWEHQAGGFLQE